mmetsp:Transcript_8074/g.16721  ORF Transcript_8074/g.16721 Transcript_8074/m.16721 type:complete len:218 (+) Transcript_8074:2998-3651(+)
MVFSFSVPSSLIESRNKSLRLIARYPLESVPEYAFSASVDPRGASSVRRTLSLASSDSDAMPSSMIERRASSSGSPSSSPRRSLASSRMAPSGSRAWTSSSMLNSLILAGTCRTTKSNDCPGVQSAIASSNESYSTLDGFSESSYKRIASTSPHIPWSSSSSCSTMSNPFCFRAARVASLAVKSMAYKVKASLISSLMSMLVREQMVSNIRLLRGPV